jgi:two-component system CheB/CheR fusion protein
MSNKAEESQAKKRSKNKSQSQKLHRTRIVAIGASAGGLEPFEAFFDAMPIESGLAFVIIQHLSPDFKSMMNELLARHSGMRICHVQDGMRVEPNTIYLNVPRTNLTIKNGCFELVDSSAHAALNHPINAFFKSLAEEMGDRAIGVILSGTGSDGTDGCRAIKEAGGTVFVQSPESAKFDGMPMWVIDAKLADAIATPQQLPAKILTYLATGQLDRDEEEALSTPPLTQILNIVHERIGTDFSDYKLSTVERRVRRRAEMTGDQDLSKYINRLNEDSGEIDALYNDLLIEVTTFFRDKEAFKRLEFDIIPRIAKSMSLDRQARVWVPGCASGEEAYSIAILFAEYAKKNDIPLNLKILATDIHTRSLETASNGIYSKEALKTLSEERIETYFEPVGNEYQINIDLRRLVVFSPHSLLSDPPFTRMDLISCRNVMIYFNDEAQQKAISMFHFALRDKGILFLGSSETVGRLKDEFDIIDQRWRIYEKRRDVRLLEANWLLPKGSGMQPSNPQANQSEFDKRSKIEERKAINAALETMLVEYAPPGFLITTTGELLHVFGDAGKYLSVEQGKFSDNVIDLLPKAFRLVLTAGIERFRGNANAQFRRQVHYRDNNDERQVCSITIKLIAQTPDKSRILLTTIEQHEQSAVEAQLIEDVAENNHEELIARYQDRIADLERDLHSTEESLQTTIEELETSNEELQATNEELMASNEELQSTNEELHSVNEELFTVSAEHQKKIEELTAMTNDMDHLLKSTNIGTIFLDEELKIRRFTPAVAKTFNLLPQDLGRPIKHVTYNFEFDDLDKVLLSVQESGKTVEREIDVDGHHYLLRILPYTPHNGETQGAVIAIIDVDELYKTRAKIEALADHYADVLSDITDYVIRWQKSGEVIYCNDVYADLNNIDKTDIVGQPVSNVLNNKTFTLDRDPEGKQQPLEYFLKDLKPNEVVALHARIDEAENTYRIRSLKVRAIGNQEGEVIAYQATGQDTTDDLRYSQAIANLTSIEQSTDLDDAHRIEGLLQLVCGFFGVEAAALLEGTDEDMQLIYSTDDGRSLKDVTPNQLEQLANSVIATTGKKATRNIIQADRKNNKNQQLIAHPVFLDGEKSGFLVLSVNANSQREILTDREAGTIRLFAGWIGVNWERQRHLQQVARSERELQRIFDAVPIHIWYKDDKNRFLKVNRAAAGFIGLAPEEIEGRDGAEIFPTMSDIYYQSDLEIIQSKRATYNLIEPYEMANGESGWVSKSKIPFFDEEDNSWKVLVTAADITPLKTVEEEIRQVNAQLNAQQKHYENLYRKTPVMMHTITPQGTILEVSDHWLQKLGYRRDEVIGHQITEFMDKQSARTAKESAIPELFKTGKIEDIEYRFICKDNSVMQVEVSGYYNVDDPNANECLAVVIDVTERNEARHAIVKKNEELQEANEGLSKFAYVASHDLQEPLRKISQFSELLVKDYRDKLDEDGHFFIDVMSSSAKRMSHLIKDLLSLSKMSHQPLQKQEVDLNNILENVISDLDVRISENDVNIVLDDLPQVSCDQTSTEQLFRNIIANAIKYKAPNRQPKIKITCRKLKNCCRITIKDNGIGFNPEFAEKMFSPFTRLHSTGDYPGSGIGLAICKTVCDRHGWAISAKGEEGKGATFIIDVT